ncbi:MAG: rhomboid family intramembrane serine protease [Rhodobiaceae bacterium]|nr:rhomboid family intramembrane serine protease [Rhodobiaceae bacterium]MCC0054132.1 rhomboid family intramembrane serine protease [Rhodobiaceae bacterium]
MQGFQGREPVFNIPRVLLVVLVALFAVHLARQALDPGQDLWVILAFGFLPARYAHSALEMPMPLGTPGAIVDFVTYAFLHGGWTHLVVNSVWLVAFGAPVAQRFGASRFLLLGGVAAIAGALAHLVTHWGEPVPMVGASAAVSGYMAAAIRFSFTPGGPLTAMGRLDPASAGRVPAEGIVDALRHRSVIMFIAVWMVFNVVFGIGVVSLGGVDQSVAWQAHIGGFAAGLLLFRLFDPVPAAGGRTGL